MVRFFLDSFHLMFFFHIFVVLKSLTHDRYIQQFSSLLFLGILLLLTACSVASKEKADSLNAISYSYHYRNLDSTKIYAERAWNSSGSYQAGKAEALNNLAFVNMAKMNYAQAAKQLDSIYSLTENQVELLVADVQHMRLCQRQSRNKEFYDYHEQAVHRMKRIEEERDRLSNHQLRRMVYATSEFHIVTSTYYYYVGLNQSSVRALQQIDLNSELHTDTAQVLAYYYNIGAGGVIIHGTNEEISQQEFDYLLNCYLIASQHGYVFWEANSLQAMSEHLQSKKQRDRLILDNTPAIKFINIDQMADSLLAGNLAERSLQLFSSYGDVYQTAGAYRTLAQCYWEIKDYPSAMIYLQKALNENKAINQAPDLVASIREQLSVVCSAIDDKQGSDYNRNIYLDMQEKTRQDRYLESRAEQLEKSSQQLNWMIGSVAVMIVAVVALLLLFDRLRRKADRKNSIQTLLVPLQEWQRRNAQMMDELEDRFADINEAYALNVIHVANNKKLNLEQRAKISLVNSITPFIDRMLHEIHRLQHTQENEQLRAERFAYIAELTDKINEYNGVLTEWIQLRQGELSLQIESFPLQQVFNIVSKSRMSYTLKDIKLIVEPTSEIVKADRILTLFMLNTMGDNARKFTPKGGVVTISSKATEKYVEISVSDTGMGMSDAEQEHLFDRKTIVNAVESAQQSTIEPQTTMKTHGYGLMNCKGIIEKYKKVSSIFSVCMLSVESKQGQGSRFFFRLPKGISRILLAAFLLFGNLPNVSKLVAATNTAQYPIDTTACQMKAANYADSAYYCNIHAEYERTLLFADSCLSQMNDYYKAIHPHGKLFLKHEDFSSATPAELAWFHDSIPVNYNVIMDVRNESAVAALALHRWSLYHYNNKVYTQLFKECSADRKLGEYCREMQKSETNKNVAIVLLLLLLLMIFPAYYFLYYRHVLYNQFCVGQVQRINQILLGDTAPEKKLTSIQKIATYRFPEKLQTVVQQITDALRVSIENRKTSQTNIELAEDERRRAQYEDEKLHVSNSILDNCLSTLKHETMYYPSRIKQLISQGDVISSLDSISELASYYKELYSVLSMQAMIQVESIKPECKRVFLSDIVPSNKLTGEVQQVTLRGDKDLLKYLFDILLKQSGTDRLTLSCKERNQRYVEFRILMPSLTLNSQECLHLFSPSREHLPYLLCRQIVRDIGESTNLRGCGMTAEATEPYTTIILTLAGTI